MNRTQRSNELKEMWQKRPIDCATYNTTMFPIWCGCVAGLLDFNPTLQAEFQKITGSPFPTEGPWRLPVTQPTIAQMSAVISQAITELAIPNSKQLTDAETLWWFWAHCSHRNRMLVIGSCLAAVSTVFGVGFAAGRVNFFVQLYDLIQKAFNK